MSNARGVCAMALRKQAVAITTANINRFFILLLYDSEGYPYKIECKVTAISDREVKH